MSRYKESLAAIPGPVMAKDVPNVRIDLRGLAAYAREKGVRPAELSEAEKARFLSLPAGTR